VVVVRWWGGLIRGGFVDLKLFSRLLQPNMAKAQWCGEVGMARADCVAACGGRGAARKERFIGEPDCGVFARPEGWACEQLSLKQAEETDDGRSDGECGLDLAEELR